MTEMKISKCRTHMVPLRDGPPVLIQEAGDWVCAPQCKWQEYDERHDRTVCHHYGDEIVDALPVCVWEAFGDDEEEEEQDG